MHNQFSFVVSQLEAFAILYFISETTLAVNVYQHLSGSSPRWRKAREKLAMLMIFEIVTNILLAKF